MRVKKINIRKKEDFAAIAGFLIVYPAYLIYQFLVFYEQIPMVFGGYFTFGVLIALPFVLISIVKQRKYLPVWRLDVGILFIIFCFVVLLTSIHGMLNDAELLILVSHYSAFVKFIAIFFLSICLNFNSTIVKKIATFSLVLLSFILISLPSGALYNSYIEIAGGVDLFQLNYQASAVVIIILLTYTLNNKDDWVRYLIYASAGYSILVLGARFELISFAIIIITVEWLRSRIKILFITSFFLMLTVGGVMLSYGSFEHRALGLLNISADESFIQRQELTASAIGVILDNPILGSYASYDPGGYAHNALSAWVDFGFFGFSLFVCLLTIPFLRILFHPKRLASGVGYEQALSSIVITIFSVIFAKDYTYTMIPFSIGIYCRYELLKSSLANKHFR